MKNVITNSGISLFLRGLTGTTVEFTKVKFGNGAEQGESAVNLNNPLLELDFTSITREDNYVKLATSFVNADIDTDFYAKEIGIFARDPDDPEKEIIYTFWYEEDESKADYISSLDDRILSMNIEFRVYVGTSKNITYVKTAHSTMAGQESVDISAGGESIVEVVFDSVLTTDPFVTATLMATSPDDAILRIQEVSKTGFIVKIKSAIGGTANFQWIACQ